jgi:hypothetical protein
VAAPIVPVTSRRARKPSPGIAAGAGDRGDSHDLVSLLKSSSVKLDGVQAVVIAWADELFDAREDEALEIVLSEIPKEARRIVVADRMTPAVEALVERHLRRASRHGRGDIDDATATVAIRYVSTTAPPACGTSSSAR